MTNLMRGFALGCIVTSIVMLFITRNNDRMAAAIAAKKTMKALKYEQNLLIEPLLARWDSLDDDDRVDWIERGARAYDSTYYGSE